MHEHDDIPVTTPIASPFTMPAFAGVLTEEQQLLRDAVQRLARERLVPLLASTASAPSVQDVARLAAALGLDTLILPVANGGAGAGAAELMCVVTELGHGPLDVAALLSISVPALLLLRSHELSGCLPAGPLHRYFDGTTSVSLTVPGADAATLWRLQVHEAAAGMAICCQGGMCHTVLAESADWSRAVTCRHRVASTGMLVLEKLTVDQAALACCTTQLTDARTQPGFAAGWLTATGLYLSALLCGTLQQAVSFVLDYSATRHAFRRPLAEHQLIAVRLADMLTAVHVATLVMRTAATDGLAAQPRALQLFRHVALEAGAVSRDTVQICGGHGYVEGLPAAAWFQQVPALAALLQRTADALLACLTRSPPQSGDIAQDAAGTRGGLA